ncbi:MAG: hypothetical protein ACTSSH_14490 [Candidatus Heimdallarchaeota archaeon]
MDSCLEVAKIGAKRRYLGLKIRYAFLKPILRKKIAQVAKNK